MAENKPLNPVRPAQHQNNQPGLENKMSPNPQSKNVNYTAANKLLNKVAIITGGDSGIGRAVGILFAKEGADVVISYLNEHEDAHETKQLIEQQGRRCKLIPGDIGDEKFCQVIVQETIKEFGKIDILVNNAAEQHPQESIEDISEQQLERTFRTNIFAQFFMVKAVLRHLKEDSVIINTSSVTAYRGNEDLLDYSSTKGAIVAFTRSLSQSLIKRKIRVNGVAPGPIWTPLIPSTYDAEKVSTFGTDAPMERAGQPEEVAPCYVFLASSDSSYMTGQFLHPNGGKIINT